MVKYAVINVATNKVLKVAFEEDGSWITFKTNYESTHPNEKLVNISTNNFPEGQSWVYNNIEYTTRDGLWQDFDTTKNNVIKQVVAKSNNLRFSTTTTYNGHQYATDQLSLLFYGVLDAEKEELTTKFPIYIPQVDVIGGYLILNNSTEMENFVHSMLFGFLDKSKDSYDLIQTVKAMTTIEQLVSFTDSRV